MTNRLPSSPPPSAPDNALQALSRLRGAPLSWEEARYLRG